MSQKEEKRFLWRVQGGLAERQFVIVFVEVQFCPKALEVIKYAPGAKICLESVFVNSAGVSVKPHKNSTATAQQIFIVKVHKIL